jgi:hypothetical protein
MEEVYPQTVRRLRKWRDNIVFVRRCSEEAVGYVPDGLDFVYVDADHRYEAVKKDLELWFAKVRGGGVLGGDDFSASYLGVVNGVQEFSVAHGLKLDGYGNDWWIVKP